MNGALRWVGVHAPAPLMLLCLAAVSAELVLGGMPAALPWAPDVDLRWGLMLPLVTVASLVTMMHTGLGGFEHSRRTEWRGTRALWCLLLVTVASAPAPFILDGLETSGSLRNRVVFASLAVIGSMIVPATLSVLTPAVLMMVSMLAAGASESPAFLGALLRPSATTADTALAVILLGIAVTTYALGYPPRWAVPGRTETL